jgi:succinate dehydrogenase/fumarate reductase flavoprotein subunit
MTLRRLGRSSIATPRERSSSDHLRGQSHPHTCYVVDETGHEMIMALTEEVRKRDIPHLDEVLVTRLLLRRGVMHRRFRPLRC